MSENKVDIFEVLNAINTKQYTFFDELSEEQQRSLAPLILQRWMTGTYDQAQIVILNEYTNRMVFPLQKHKSLLFKMLCAASPGHPQRYKWRKQASTKVTNPETLKIIQEYFTVGQSEATDLLSHFDCEDILEMGMEIGTDPKILKAVEKEFK